MLGQPGKRGRTGLFPGRARIEEVFINMAADPGRTRRGARPADGKDTRAATSPERITVALIPKAAADLQKLLDRTGLSKTDITNRAITAYEFIEAQISAGKEIIISDPKTGDQKSVLFL
jgi:hypothetical protein